MAAQPRIRRDQPRLHQRRDESKETCGIAAGVADPDRMSHRLAPGDLGQTIGPAFGNAVGGGGVDHAGPRIADEGHGLPRGIVGQAQDHDIGVVERLGARARVLAPGLVKRDHAKACPSGQPLRDLEPRRARRAVDENAGQGSILRRATMGSAWLSRNLATTSASGSSIVRIQ